MIDRYTDRPDVARAARWVAALAFLSYLLLAFAQQGGIGSSLRPVPERPLPFDRAQVFGIDLSDRSSAGALQWVTESGGLDTGLVLLPVDADIVSAIADEEAAAGGAAAIDSLLQPVGSTPVALCLRRPLTAQSASEVLTTIVELIRDEFSNRIAYMLSCDESTESDWQASLAEALGADVTDPDTLLPVTSGATIRLEQVATIEALEVGNLRTFAGEQYIMPVIPMRDALVATQRVLAGNALRNAAQLALVLVRPAGEADPESLTASTSNEQLADPTLVEGFNAVSSAPIQWNGEWQTSEVGPITYRRTEDAGLSLSTQFIGTSLYMNALLSPEAGEIEVWIDRPPNTEGADPDRAIPLTSTQARDGVVQLADGLPAASHDVHVTTAGGEVAISGIFVSGRPEHDWISGLASASLLLLAVGALTVANIGRVREIRRRTRPPRPPADDRLFERQPRQ